MEKNAETMSKEMDKSLEILTGRLQDWVDDAAERTAEKNRPKRGAVAIRSSALVACCVLLTRASDQLPVIGDTNQIAAYRKEVATLNHQVASSQDEIKALKEAEARRSAQFEALLKRMDEFADAEKRMSDRFDAIEKLRSQQLDDIRDQLLKLAEMKDSVTKR